MNIFSYDGDREAFEWRTGALSLVIFGAWLFLILHYRELPPAAANIALVVVCAW